MSGLGQDLQDYLSRNQKDTKISVSEDSSSSGFSLGKLNFFNKSDRNSQSDSNDVANGWFSQAQQDPYLPSLVCPWKKCHNLTDKFDSKTNTFKLDEMLCLQVQVKIS